MYFQAMYVHTTHAHPGYFPEYYMDTPMRHTHTCDTFQNVCKGGVYIHSTLGFMTGGL